MAPLGRVSRWAPPLREEVRLALEDRVQLQRLYLAWVGPPRFDPDEAPLDVLISILGEGRSSRLYRSLVYEKQVAREVGAYYASMEIAGEIRIDATVAPGASVEAVEEALLAEIERRATSRPPTKRCSAPINRLEAHYVRQLESLGGFGGRADLLNYFNVFTGDPGRLNKDFDRYLTVTPADVQRMAQQYLDGGRVRLVISPQEEVTAKEQEVDRTQKPGPGRPRTFQPPVPRRIKLAGDLDLLVVEKREVPTVAFGLYLPGGAVLDPQERPAWPR